MYKKQAGMRRNLLPLCINFQREQFIMSRVLLNFSKRFYISFISLAIVEQDILTMFFDFFLVLYYYIIKKNYKIFFKKQHFV